MISTFLPFRAHPTFFAPSSNLDAMKKRDMNNEACGRTCHIFSDSLKVEQIHTGKVCPSSFYIS